MADPLDLILQGLSSKLSHDLETADEMANNILVTGAVQWALMEGGRFGDIECVGYPNPGATNVLELQPDFMKSRYRITVERVPD